MFHPFVAVFDEIAFMPDAEQCFNAVAPVAKQVIGVSSADPGWMGDQCSDPGITASESAARIRARMEAPTSAYPYPIDRREFDF
jgi:hypothetical protein